MGVVYPAMFIHGLNLSEINVMGELLTEAGLDASRYLEAITTDEVKNLLRKREREVLLAPQRFLSVRQCILAKTGYVGLNRTFLPNN